MLVEYGLLKFAIASTSAYCQCHIKVALYIKFCCMSAFKRSLLGSSPVNPTR